MDRHVAEFNQQKKESTNRHDSLCYDIEMLREETKSLRKKDKDLDQ